MKTIAIISLLIASSFGFAQGQNTILTIRDLQNYMTTSGEYRYVQNSNSEIKGSPFLNEEFDEGLIRYDGNWYKGVKMRYDAFNEEIQVELEKGIIVLDPTRNPVDSLVLNNATFVKTLLKLGNEENFYFLESLYASNGTSLNKRYQTSFQEAKPASAYGDAKPAKFSKNQPKYYLIDSEKTVDVKNLKSLAEFYGSDEKSIKSYLKKNKLNVNKESDLIQIVTYLSSSE